MDAPLIESFAALEAAIDIDQHGLQWFQIEPTQAIAQSVIAKGAFGADPVLEMGVGQFAVQLLEARESEDEAVKQGQEDASRRDLRSCERPACGWRECSDRNPC